MEYEKLNDKEKLKFLGIKEGKPFEIIELSGKYIIEGKVAYEVAPCGTKYEVKGLYKHILDGTWHTRWKGIK